MVKGFQDCIIVDLTEIRKYTNMYVKNMIKGHESVVV